MIFYARYVCNGDDVLKLSPLLIANLKTESLIAKYLVTECVTGFEGVNGFPVFF